MKEKISRQDKFIKHQTWADILFLGVLLLYPMRRVCFGVDLWDGGYNYANFRFSGPEFMDSMWYFATWISTQVGSLLMHLPFGSRMIGMNIYTGLTVSALAVLGYLFCRKQLRLPAIVSFLSQITACSLCLLPTAALYNYLTFLLLMCGILFLYLGSTGNRKWYLIAAGVCLGLNVGVRFSNLVQMGLILALWAYGFFERQSVREIAKKTGWCILGYLGGLLIFLLPIGILYGFSDYAAGIARLFSMTEIAEDYAPGGMLSGAVSVYLEPETRYWIKRFGMVLAAGTAVFLPLPGRFVRAKKAAGGILTAVLFVWLLKHRFVYPDFAMYDSIYAPCVMLLLLAMMVSVFFLINKKFSGKDKMLAVLELLIIFLTSLGGNNAVYYNINNMFLILPVLLYMLWIFWKESDWYFQTTLTVSVLTVLVCLVALRFGNTFSYEEATGGRSYAAEITEVPVLKGMYTSSEKAEELTKLYRFLEEKCLRSYRCVLYGEIPGISYYMDMPPALNVWGDLRSYVPSVMKADLEQAFETGSDGEEKLLVILERRCADYMEGFGEPAAAWDRTAIQKLEFLKDCLEDRGYVRIYESGKYVIYHPAADR